LRNSSLSLKALILGLGLGVIPVLFIVSNAFLIGMLIRVMGRGEGIYFVLMLLLPHGVIEIPAVLLSAAMGVKMGQEVLFALLGREHEIKREFLRCMRRFFLIVLPLLAIAAIIEVYITPLTVI
jgi:stage II sporulation protein M